MLMNNALGELELTDGGGVPGEVLGPGLVHGPAAGDLEPGPAVEREGAGKAPEPLCAGTFPTETSRATPAMARYLVLAQTTCFIRTCPNHKAQSKAVLTPDERTVLRRQVERAREKGIEPLLVSPLRVMRPSTT